MTRPTVEEIREELHRTEYRQRYHLTLRNTIFSLVVVSALAILVATLLLPVLRTYGSSMSPTLEDGEIVFSLRTEKVKRGDVIAFYYNNKILVKRVIGTSGDWIDIDRNGIVSVNGLPIDEPYISEPALGECTIKLPYQVPEGRIFVMGDHRALSVDSRSSEIGCVAGEQIVGKLEFRVWPVERIGKIS